jgi:hypothetical protein
LNKKTKYVMIVSLPLEAIMTSKRTSIGALPPKTTNGEATAIPGQVSAAPTAPPCITDPGTPVDPVRAKSGPVVVAIVDPGTPVGPGTQTA